MEKEKNKFDPGHSKEFYENRELNIQKNDDEFYLDARNKLAERKEAKRISKMKRPKYLIPKAELIKDVEEKKGKLTKAKKEELENYVIKRMMDGATTRDLILEFARDYNFSESKTQHLVSSANKAICKHTQAERLILKEKNHALLQDLYQKNIEKGDLREARTILEVFNKMYGLNEADRLELSGNIIKFKFDIAASINQAPDQQEGKIPDDQIEINPEE